MVDDKLLAECLAKLYFRVKNTCYNQVVNFTKIDCNKCPAPCGCGIEMREAKRILTQYIQEGNHISNIKDTAI